MLFTVALETAVGLAAGCHAEQHEKTLRADQRSAHFDPRSIALPARSPERAARAMLETGRYSAAADLLGTALALCKDPDVRGRLRWLLADALAGQEDAPALQETLRALGRSRHPLAPRARLRLAFSLHETAPQTAITLLRPLQQGYAFARRAKLLLGLALKRAGRTRQAVEVLEPLVAAAPQSTSGGPAAMPLAELLALQKTTGDQLRALSLFRRIASRRPLSAEGKLAESRYNELLETLPKRAQRKARLAHREYLLARGDALLRSHAYDLAVSAFDAAAKALIREPKRVCQVQLEKGRALLRKRDRAQGAALMDTLLDKCKDREVRAWARYYAGQTHVRMDAPAVALLHYDALPREAPKHRLADDALYLGGLAAESLGDLDGLRARLQRLVAAYPHGDMRPEALFTLAWEARSRQAYHDALRYLDELAAHPQYETKEGLRGRAAYWRARTLQDMGRFEAAMAGYQAVARSQRLGYHTQQALQRLRELDPRSYRRLLSELRPTDEAPLVFNVVDRMSTPGFRAAIALLQVGELAQAQEELRAIGLLGRNATEDERWLVASLYDAAGAYPQASALGRRLLSTFMNESPRGVALRKWRIAYPNAFSPAIEHAAAEANVAPAYVRAVAREESAFDPAAVSSAHAYGLIQLIGPTAREYAEPLGLPSHPSALKQPRINLRIGSHFIQDLWQRFAENPAVVPAAYNAGPYAAERWIRDNPGMPLDEWVESIPYSETRRYTRRVLQTYGIYRLLETGRFPPLPQKLPKVVAN